MRMLKKKKKKFFIFLKRKIKKIISLDGVFIPKVKHLNVEKKKIEFNIKKIIEK